MMKHLVIIRHGNTFRPGEPSLRVGRRSDLPLVEEERARLAGQNIARLGLLPSRVVAAPLLRTMQTAALVLQELGLECPIEASESFSEIDYGPDEAKSEEEVVARIGQAALDLWNRDAIPPPGWQVKPEKIVQEWQNFAQNIRDQETVLVVSSNGIIRFAPQILPPLDYQRFATGNDLKVTTGGLCVFRYEKKRWFVDAWNVKPR